MDTLGDIHMQVMQFIVENIDEKGYPVKIEVDGGVGKRNVREVIGAGADICVAGSAVFKKRSISDNISQFMKAFGEKEDK